MTATDVERMRAAGNDVVKASNTLMLMLTGDISLSKKGLEQAIRTALDARNAWDNALKGGVE